MFYTQTTLVLSHLKPYLCYAMCFTMRIIFIYFDKHSPNLGRDTCLAPEEFQRSISGPWPKKVVHHCAKGLENLRFHMRCLGDALFSARVT